MSRRLFLILGFGAFFISIGMWGGYYYQLLKEPTLHRHDRVSLFLLENLVAHTATIKQLHRDQKSFDSGLVIKVEGYTDVYLSTHCANLGEYVYELYESSPHTVYQPHIKLITESPIFSCKKQMVIGEWCHGSEGGYLKVVRY